jgi:hypothetical protein
VLLSALVLLLEVGQAALEVVDAVAHAALLPSLNSKR